MRALLLAACLLVLASAARAGSGFPYMRTDGVENTYNRASTFPVIDTLAIPANRTRGVYLLAPSSGTVRGPVDSLLEVWRNGGAVPKFKKIQHLTIWHNSVDEEQWGLTIFDVRGTSHMQFVTQPYQVIDWNIEADSLQVQGVSPKSGATQVDLGYAVW